LAICAFSVFFLVDRIIFSFSSFISWPPNLNRCISKSKTRLPLLLHSSSARSSMPAYSPICTITFTWTSVVRINLNDGFKKEKNYRSSDNLSVEKEKNHQHPELNSCDGYEYDNLMSWKDDFIKAVSLNLKQNW